jgi:hypothetical protein
MKPYDFFLIVSLVVNIAALTLAVMAYHPS